MSNLEILNSAFSDVFSVNEEKLNESFINVNVDGWDSIRHLTLVTAIEDAFDIMFDPEDIIAITSYKTAKEVLSSKYGIEL